MAILLDETTVVVVQGATGKEGQFRIQMMAFFGEIGTTNEEDAAALIKAGGFTKPVVAYVSGRYARPGMRFGHAGAIISRGIGTAEAKIAALRDTGVQVVERLGDIGPAPRRILDTL